MRHSSLAAGFVALLLTAAVSAAEASPGSGSDTTISVQPGTSLEIENFGGGISVNTWDKDALKISVDRSVRDQVRFRWSGRGLHLESKARHYVPGMVNYRITAPRWMRLVLSGINTSIDVENCGGDVHAETVNGDVVARGGTGFMSLSTVQGEVRVERVRGRVDASSVNQGVHLVDVAGPVVAESVNGPIMIQRARSDSIEASTLNGPVTYEGEFSYNGSYRFTTHNGCIAVVMPEKVDATVSLSTFSGGIDSSFPVTLKKLEAKRFRTVLGQGRAKVDLESFQGTIFLRRPNEPGSDCTSYEEDEKEHEKRTGKVHEKIKQKVHKYDSDNGSDEKGIPDEDDDEDDDGE